MPHRYFTTEISDGTAVLRGADAHHLSRVMRGKPGDTVILCDGKAVEYTADLRRGTVTVNEPNATIAYTAGGYVPFMVRQAMLLLIGHWYANREAVTTANTSEVDMAAQAMLRQYKGWWF